MSEARRPGITLMEFGRYAMITAPLSVAIFYLMFFLRRDLWTWRLALFAGLFGFIGNAVAVLLRLGVLGRERRLTMTIAQIIFVPLDFTAGLIAFIATDRLTKALLVPAFHFGDSDQRVALSLCGLLSVAGGFLFYVFHITRQRLRRSIRRVKDQELTERELALARTIQQRLLPPEHVMGNGYDISAKNLAAHYVAGDFYDVFPLSDGAVAVVVADVAGKGIGASLIMASVKAVLPLVADGRRPDATLIELNRRLHEKRVAREFVAMAYARYDASTGVLELANAGLPDPYLIREGTAPETLAVPGPRLPLAVRRHVPYQVLTVKLNPGERIIMFTDGLPEATAASGEQIGYEFLEEVITLASQKPGNLIEPLFRLIQDASTPKIEDDWTALVLCATQGTSYT